MKQTDNRRPRLRRGTALNYVLTLFSVPMVACSAAPVEEEVRSVEKAISGGQLYENSCTWRDRLALRHGGIFQRVATRTDFFDNCLREGMRDDYEPCDGTSEDPFLSFDWVGQKRQLETALAQPNPMQIRCEDQSFTSPGDILGWSHQENEEFSIAEGPRDVLASNLSPLLGGSGGTKPGDGGVELVGGLMAHEALHTHGYLHSESNENVCGAQQGSKHDGTSAPYIAQACISRVGLARIFCPETCAAGGTIPMPGPNEDECICESDTWVYNSVSGNEDVIDPPTDIEFSAAAGDLIGYAMAAGDFNRDGYDDLAVGHPGANDGAGLVAVYYGTIWGLMRHYTLENPNGDDSSEFGRSLATADLDEDGHADLVIGAPGEDDNRGRVHLYMGKEGRPEPSEGSSGFGYRADAGRSPGDRFGEAITTGFSQLPGTLGRANYIAAGSPGAGAGRVEIFRVSNENLEHRKTIPAATTDSDAEFGASLHMGRTGSGSFGALIVGAPGDQNDRGSAYFYRFSTITSASNLGTEPEFEMSPPNGDEGSRFGQAVRYGSFGSLGGKVAVGAPGLSQVFLHERLLNPDVDPGDLVETLTGPHGSEFGASFAGMHTARDHLAKELENDSAATPNAQPIGVHYADEFDRQLLVGAPGGSEENPGGVVFRYSHEDEAPILEDAVSQNLLSDDEQGDSFGSAIAVGAFARLHRESAGEVESQIAVGAAQDTAGSLGSRQTGAYYVFRHLPGCTTSTPWQVYSEGARLDTSTNTFPAANFSSLLDYKVGDLVADDCKVYRAVEDDGGFPWNDPDSWEVILEPVTQDLRAPEFTSFESEDSWTASSGDLEIDNDIVNEGEGSLMISSPGWVEITSPPFSTNEFFYVGNEITVDVYVPEEQPGSGWQGAVQLYATIAGANIYHAYLGQVELTGLEAGEWHEATFNVPQDVYDAFLSDYPIAQLHLVSNVATNAPGRTRFDHLRFTGDLVEHPNPEAAIDPPPGSDFECTGECVSAQPIALNEQIGGFGTTNAVWFEANGDIQGWTASSWSGRRMFVNGIEVQNGEIPLPAATNEGKRYFLFTEGDYTWASFTYW